MMQENTANFLSQPGITHAISREHLLKALQRGEPLRVKFGVDPTAPDIHLGHAVALFALRAFQDAGHTIILVIGDFTARIGDPSGSTKTRPVLDEQTIARNAKTYLEQAGHILNINQVEVVSNSAWLANLKLAEFIKLLMQFTAAQILERDDFAKRLKARADIGLHELLYPVLQAYDSLHLQTDLEVGGNDQLFNLLAGRQLQERMGQSPQDIITFALLPGTDGKQKMSKSLGNYIGITDSPDEMFGKLMSLPDDAMPIYANLLLTDPESITEQIGKTAPRDLKAALAKSIIARLYPSAEADEAAARFTRQFKEKQPPLDVPTAHLNGNWSLSNLLVELKFAASRNAARRLIDQMGVKIDGALQTDPEAHIELTSGMIIQAGKRNFAKIA